MRKIFYYVAFIATICFTACTSEEVLMDEEVAISGTKLDADSAYDKLVDAFSSGTRSGDETYPDYYGGAYVKNGKLVVRTQEQYLDDNSFSDILGKEGYDIEVCDFSYNELKSVMQIVLAYVTNNPQSSVGSNIQSCGISGKKNKVIVYLNDCTDGKIAVFKQEVINSPVIDFEQATGTIVEASLYPMAPGTEIQVAAGEGSGGSMGYRAKYTKNGVTTYGFVTCAHVVASGSTVKYNGTNVGASDPTRWVHSGLDATFCTFSSTRYEMSNLIGTTGKTLSAATGFAAASSTVLKYGRTTFESDGKVENESTFYTVNGIQFTDVVRVKNMDAASGDSGGIVYNASLKTLGIVSAIELDGNKNPTGVVWYMKAPNINIRFGIDRY